MICRIDGKVLGINPGKKENEYRVDLYQNDGGLIKIYKVNSETASRLTEGKTASFVCNTYNFVGDKGQAVLINNFISL